MGSFFTALGVLCCFALFVCLTLLASFFLPSHLSFKNMYIIIQNLKVIEDHQWNPCIQNSSHAFNDFSVVDGGERERSEARNI